MILILSQHVNAIGIAARLRELKYSGEVICIGVNVGYEPIAARFPKLCSYLDISATTTGDAVEQLHSRIQMDRVSHIFFCDERFLTPDSLAELTKRNPSCRLGCGRSSRMEKVLDRKEFHRYLVAERLASVPQMLTGPPDWSRGNQRCRVRVYRSWDGLRKLPRGRTLTCASDLALWLEHCEQSGTSRHEWGFEEFVGDGYNDLYSVSGCFGQSCKCMVVSKWVCEQGENGQVIERVSDPADLCHTTERILTRLEYDGPFELEFLFDGRDGKYKVIELNPRFWMQHRIFRDGPVDYVYGVSESDLKGTVDRYWYNPVDKAFSLRELWLLFHANELALSVPLLRWIVSSLSNKAKAYLK